jgi:hypothetical protein
VRAGTAEQPHDAETDPLGERRRAALHERFQLMGGEFDFETDSSRLLRIVTLAFARLPTHKLHATAPRFAVKLALSSAPPRRSRSRSASEPPPVRPLAGGGVLCGAMDSANFVALSPQERSALVVVSQDMLKFPYHVRYEMLEFAVYVLAARAQGLVPLHGACVGRAGQGILLLGPSGSGKSTLSLHCLLQGLDFLAEDSVFVRPDDLLATGVPNFLHTRADSLRFITDASCVAAIRQSPVIRRRSGVEKFEIDLRKPRYRLAAAPLRIGAVVFVSPRPAPAGALLAPIRKAQLTQQLTESQPYAAHQPGWSDFSRQVSRLPVFELRRGRHPLHAIEALERLLPVPAGDSLTPAGGSRADRSVAGRSVKGSVGRLSAPTPRSQR